MSTTASHVIELVRSLPAEDQRAIRAALASPECKAEPGRRRKLQHLPDGSYLNPNGIPNDDPVFQVLEKIEQERHETSGRPALGFD